MTLVMRSAASLQFCFTVLSAACCILPADVARAQTAGEKLGVFGFVNAADADTPTFLEINGQRYKVTGYLPGQMSMAAQLREGPTVFAVDNERLGRAQLDEEVSSGRAVNLFAYVGKKKGDDGKETDEIRLIKSQSKPSSREYKWSGLYLSGGTNSAAINISGAPVALAPMKMTPLPARGSIAISLKQGAPPVLRASPDEPAHYIVIAYDKKDGSIGLTLFVDAPPGE
jgi:hypothetical protein